jgi:ELWxxDGT repeat protein
MYFNARRGLWRTDGTAGGTLLLKEGAAFFNQTHDHKYTGALGGRFYFSVPAPLGTVELWSSDGTVNGTVRLATFGNNPAALQDFTAVGDLLYFVASGDDSRGFTRFDLWRTDGTEQGTFRVPWDVPNSPYDLEELNGELLLGAFDLSTVGGELWKVPAPPPPSFVVGRHVFYNNSRFDGRDVGANRGDDGAIASDKQALGFGEIGSFQNVTSYARGINGLMVDITTRLDFYDEVQLSFRVGTGGDPSGWSPAPTPLSVTHRIDGVPEDIDRVTVVWPDGAIRNTWLQVTAEALFGGRVVASDVFYFGNLIGETGTAPALRVDAADFAATRAHVREAATLTHPFDFNRDGRVDTLDLNAVRGNLFKSLGAIAGPPPPAAGSAGPADAGAVATIQRSRPPTRRSTLLAVPEGAAGDVLV